MPESRRIRMPDEPGNQTPTPPDVSETELRAKKVDELRDEAREAGVSGASSMRKDDLVHAVAEAEQASADGSRKRGHDADAAGEAAGPDGATSARVRTRRSR